MENLWTVILAVLGAYLAVALAIAVLTVIAWWRLFSKAGQAGLEICCAGAECIYALYKYAGSRCVFGLRF